MGISLFQCNATFIEKLFRLTYLFTFIHHNYVYYKHTHTLFIHSFCSFCLQLRRHFALGAENLKMAALLISPINMKKYTGIIDLIKMCYSTTTIHLLFFTVFPFVDSKVILSSTSIITISEITFVTPEKEKVNVTHAI